MEQKQVSLEKIYNKLLSIERVLESKGIIVEDDEGELTDEFRIELEERRKTPDSEYISFGEVKKRVLEKK